MNGRVYDYQLGKFLSVDPFIKNPLNSQSLNPYSYIGNNPLSGTDPTGYEACTTDNPCVQNPAASTGSHIAGAMTAESLAATGGSMTILHNDAPSSGLKANGASPGASPSSSSGSRSDQQAGQGSKGMAPTSANDTILPTGSKDTSDLSKMTETNDWRDGNKADQFLKDDYAKRGQSFCTAACAKTDEDAEAQAANRYTGAGIQAHREVQWWVYLLADKTFSFTYPWVTAIDSHYGRPPDIDRSLGSISSSGHVHWDGNHQFSGMDWIWARDQRGTDGNRVRLYLSSGDGALKQTDWRNAHSQGDGPTHSGAPQNFDGKIVPGVKVNAAFDENKN